MLDDEDGRVFEYTRNNSQQIQICGDDYGCGLTDDGKFQIVGVDPDDSLRLQDNDGQSRWQVQMGLKYRF